MEFVSHEEVGDLLREYGVERLTKTEDQVFLRMGDPETVHVHLACPDSKTQPVSTATRVDVDKARLHKVVEHVIHLLNISQGLLIPVGKWRKVFDAVAFSLASNEDWQAVDAVATVELNTRDPLLCEPADFHLLIDLIRALLQDAENADQGLTFVATASPVLIEIVPDGAIRISMGSQVLADEAAAAFAV